MRVLLVTQFYAPEAGAPQVRLAALASELRDRGHSVDVLTALPNHPTGRIFDGYRHRLAVREHIDGARVTRLWILAALGSGLPRVLSYVSFAVGSMIGLVFHRRPDLVIVESPPPLVVPAAWARARLWRVPVVMNVADLWPDTAVDLGAIGDGAQLRFLQRLERWCYRHVDVISVPTEGLREALVERKGVPVRKVTFLPNGVDPELFSPGPVDADVLAELSPDGSPVFLYAGTVGIAHGAEILIDALVEVRRTHPGVRLAFMGGGSELGALRRRVDDLAVEGVVFLGVCSPQKVAAGYRIAAAGVTTLRPKESGLSVRPAKMFPTLASGCPLVFSGGGEGAALVADAQAALVTPPGDAHALAESMRWVLDEPIKAGELGEKGRKFAIDTFTWTAIVSSWLEELGAVIDLPEPTEP